LLQSALLTCRIHRLWHCTRRGIAITVDVDDYAFGLQSQPVCCGGNNSPIGLMRNEGVNITSLQAIALKNLFANFCLLADRELEYCLAVLVNIMHLFVHRFVSGGMQASPTRHVKGTSPGAVH